MFSKTKSAPASTVTFTSREFMFPATVSFEVGFVVPIPTFPILLTLICSTQLLLLTLFVAKTISAPGFVVVEFSVVITPK
ncbi:hypothetical protein D3C84_1041870 [compost metagenome]